MKDEFKLLEETIKSKCSYKPVYYVANHGNWGDGLIRESTLKFLKTAKIRYKELRNTKRTFWRLRKIIGGTVLYDGGGAWCNAWKFGCKEVSKYSKNFQVVVLPSSYELKPRIPNTTFFCRDLYESKENVPSAIFCHDMVLYNESFKTSGKGNGTGYLFRTDRESSGKNKLPASNNDISTQGNTYSGIGPFVEYISNFKIIYTDRLHVAITGCLLGREVHLYPGNYFKNRAVYDSSLKDNFDNIFYHSDFGEFGK